MRSRRRGEKVVGPALLFIEQRQLGGGREVAGHSGTLFLFFLFSLLFSLFDVTN